MASQYITSCGRSQSKHTGHRKPPSPSELNLILDETFFRPAATRATHDAATELVSDLFDRLVPHEPAVAYLSAEEITRGISCDTFC
jgi:hypothetical protein